MITFNYVLLQLSVLFLPRHPLVFSCAVFFTMVVFLFQDSFLFKLPPPARDVLP